VTITADEYIANGVANGTITPAREDNPDAMVLDEFTAWMHEQHDKWAHRANTSPDGPGGEVALINASATIALEYAQVKLSELADKYPAVEPEKPAQADTEPYMGPIAYVLNGYVEPGDRVAWSTRSGSYQDMSIGEVVLVTPMGALKVRLELTSGFRTSHGPSVVTLKVTDRVVKL